MIAATTMDVGDLLGAVYDYLLLHFHGAGGRSACAYYCRGGDIGTALL